MSTEYISNIASRKFVSISRTSCILILEAMLVWQCSVCMKWLLVICLCVRTSELNDALAVSDRSLKRLASNIENELHSYYGGVNPLYKRKYHALMTSLKDRKSMVFTLLLFISYHTNQSIKLTNPFIATRRRYA